MQLVPLHRGVPDRGLGGAQGGVPTRLRIARGSRGGRHRRELPRAAPLQRWYASVPDLGEKVACLAWQLRAQTPFIVAQGGVNARMAKVFAAGLSS
jgi:hypothetical protein